MKGLRGAEGPRAPTAPSVHGIEPPEKQQSVFQSWLHELIAIDMIRKTAATLFLEMRNEPEKCVNFADALNEMYRVLRPMCDDKELLLFDRHFDEALKMAEEYSIAYLNRKSSSMATESVPSEIRTKLNDLFHSVYMLRHIHGLGFKVKEKTLTGKQAAQRSLQI